MHETPGPSTGTRRAVELSQTSNAPVWAGRSEHSVVFFSRGLRKARSDVKHTVYRVAVSVSSYAGDTLLVEALDLDTRGVLNPALELRSALRVLKARKFLSLLKKSRPDNGVNLDRVLCEVKVYADAAVVDMLVVNPEGLFLLIYREARELLPDSPL